MVFKHWKRLPREVVESQSLGVFIIHAGIENMIQLWTWWWWLDLIILEIFSNSDHPRILYNHVNSCLQPIWILPTQICCHVAKNVSFISSFEQVYKVHCLHSWQNFSTSTNLQYPTNPDTDYPVTAPACLHNDSWMVSQYEICKWERCLKRALGIPPHTATVLYWSEQSLSSITPLLTLGNNSSYIRKEVP